MSRRWLVVLDDPKSEFSLPEELEAYLNALLTFQLGEVSIARVQRGGLLADKVMAELPPVRHERMGRGR
jgi:hypothetical protein